MRAAIAFALLASSAPDFQTSGDAREFAPDIISTKYSDVRLTISPDGDIALDQNASVWGDARSLRAFRIWGLESKLDPNGKTHSPLGKPAEAIVSSLFARRG